MSKQKVSTKVVLEQQEYEKSEEAARLRKGVKKELRRKYKNSKKSMPEEEVLDLQGRSSQGGPRR
jgi:hypothetical protein